MPVMDGHEAIRRIRAMAGGEDAKIIAVTASAMDENRQELMEIGADDFIGKPFREAELFQKIHAHVGVEYVYAEEPAAAAPEEAAELTPESLAGWPRDLIDPMREAVITADLDQLLATIQEAEARDPRIAQGLRRLAEGFQYQKLLDLFGTGAPIESGERREPAPAGPPASWSWTTPRPISRCWPACSRTAGTRSARSPAASWRCWRRDAIPPDLILLDINMPEMNGYEVCEHLKADDGLKGIPVIFISALTEPLDKVKAFATGGVDYLTKPFQMEELHARVETHLKLRRLQVELEEANARLAAANGRMSRDLKAAAKIQETFLPRAAPRVPGADFAWAYRPCDELAGDGLNVVPLGDGKVGLYVLDVSGHGVASALLSVTLSRLLSPPSEPSSILVRDGEAGIGPRSRRPPRSPPA